MFVLLPEHRFQIPEALCAPGATYWRSLAVSTNALWYIRNLRIGPDALVDTFLLVWDTDLLDTTKADGVKADSLQHVRQLREVQGISQERLGELTELHRTYVGSIERKEPHVSIDNVERIASALGVDIADLLARY